MLRTKNILGLMLVFVMVVVPVISVGAASPAQTTTIDGTIQSCVTVTDAFTGEPIVVCEINLTAGGIQTVRLSLEDAVVLKLAVLNEDGTVTIIAVPEQIVSIDPSLVLADPCVMPEDASQPISKALTNFFCGSLGMDYDILQSLHEDGFGFGEIAQACFMAAKLEGTGSLCQEILYAKKSGDYSALTLPEGVTVTNWGQLRKAVFSHESRNTTNLGTVVSDNAKNNGHANNEHVKNEHGKEKK